MVITVVAALGLVGVDRASAVVSCPPDLSGQTINDTVVVPPNSTCRLNGNTISGSVIVGRGATLFLGGNTIRGSISAEPDAVVFFQGDTVFGNASGDGASLLTDCTTHLYGNLTISRQPIGVNSASLCGAATAMRIDGNVTFANNASNHLFDGPVSVGGALTITNNTGDLTFRRWQIARGINIFNNVGAGTNNVEVTNATTPLRLVCSGNTPVPTTTGTVAGGGRFGQCV